MMVRRVVLAGCAAVALFAQDSQGLDKYKLERDIEKAMADAKHEAMEATREAMEHQQEMLARLKNGATLFAKEAGLMDRALFAMQAPAPVKAGGGPLSDEEEMKLMAIDSIMQADTERAVPIVDRVLQNPQASLRLRLRALQALGRSSSPKAREVLVRMAKDNGNVELQSRALQLLGSRDSSQNRQLLGEIYAASASADIKRQVLRSWASAGAKEQVLGVAKSDSNPEVRESAIRHLGQMNASAEIASLYAAESSAQIREQLLRSLAQAGDWQKLLDIAKTDKNDELRNRAIQYAGSMRAAGVPEALVAFYSSTADTATRNAILRGLSQQRNAKQLIAVARIEKDPELKRAALQHLSRMKGDDVTNYLTELLEK